MTTIGMLGAGRMAQMLTPKLIAAGHQVILTNSRGPDSLSELVGKFGSSARAMTPAAMVKAADVVVLATRWPQTQQAVAALGPWNGKVVIDCTNNRLSPRPEDVIDIGDKTSSEVVAAMLPGAKLVKAFNSEPIPVYDASLPPKGDNKVIFLAGDDTDAKSVVAQLIRDLGAEPIDVGNLKEGGRQLGLGGPCAMKMRLMTVQEAKSLLA